MADVGRYALGAALSLLAGGIGVIAILAIAIAGAAISTRTRRKWTGWAAGLTLFAGYSVAIITIGGGPESIRCKGADPKDPCGANVYTGGDWDAR